MDNSPLVGVWLIILLGVGVGLFVAAPILGVLGYLLYRIFTL